MVEAALISGWLVALAHITTPHADELAQPIAQAAETLEEARLLAVTLDAEGGVRRAVMSCRILGDHGKAIGGWQLHRWWIRGPVADFCRNPTLQAACALRALGFGDTIRARIAHFMGRAENDKEVSRRVLRYERLLRSDS